MSSQAIPPLITQPTPTPEEQFRLFQESQEKLYIHDIFKRAMSRVIKQEKEGGPSIDIRFIQTNQKVEIQAENTKTRYEFISDLSQLDNRDLASCVETILKLNQKIIDEQRVKNLIVQRREPSSSRKPPFRPLAPSSRPPMLPQTSSSSSSSSVSQSFASPASLNQSLLSIGQLTNPDFRPSSAPQPQQQPGLGNSTQPHSASLEPFQILSLSPQPHEPLRSQLTTSSSASSQAHTNPSLLTTSSSSLLTTSHPIQSPAKNAQHDKSGLLSRQIGTEEENITTSSPSLLTISFPPTQQPVKSPQNDKPGQSSNQISTEEEGEEQEEEEENITGSSPFSRPSIGSENVVEHGDLPSYSNLQEVPLDEPLDVARYSPNYTEEDGEGDALFGEQGKSRTATSPSLFQKIGNSFQTRFPRASKFFKRDSQKPKESAKKNPLPPQESNPPPQRFSQPSSFLQKIQGLFTNGLCAGPEPEDTGRKSEESSGRKRLLSVPRHRNSSLSLNDSTLLPSLDVELQELSTDTQDEQ